MNPITDVTPTYNLTVGMVEPPSSSFDWDGDVDEFIIINRTLTEQEILDAYRLKSDKYFWFVNVSDQYTENQSEAYEFRINRAPEFATGPSLTPTNANTTDTYTCSFTIVDDDPEDSLTYSGDFLNFTTSVGSFSSSTSNGTLVQQSAGGDVQGKSDQNTCEVTASDNYESASAATSNIVTVLNSPPNTPPLIAPEHLNQTFNRTPSFDYNQTTDPDNDELNYTLNLACLSTAGGSCTGAGDDRLLNYTTNTSELAQELQFFIDDNFFYNWTVLAFDGDNESDYADPPRSINISVLVDIALLTTNVDFGTFSVGQTDDTDDGTPSPFSLRNNGNVEIEVNLSENSTSSLFASQIAPSPYYQFKADNATSEPGAFSWENSSTTYINVPRTPTNLTVFRKFNHTDTIDESQIDINITVPQDEPAGYKESTIEFIGYYVSAV